MAGLSSTLARLAVPFAEFEVTFNAISLEKLLVVSAA